jgi:hypothetical protein
MPLASSNLTAGDRERQRLERLARIEARNVRLAILESSLRVGLEDPVLASRVEADRADEERENLAALNLPPDLPMQDAGPDPGVARVLGLEIASDPAIATQAPTRLPSSAHNSPPAILTDVKPEAEWKSNPAFVSADDSGPRRVVLKVGEESPSTSADSNLLDLLADLSPQVDKSGSPGKQGLLLHDAQQAEGAKEMEFKPEPTIRKQLTHAAYGSPPKSTPRGYGSSSSAAYGSESPGSPQEVIGEEFKVKCKACKEPVTRKAMDIHTMCCHDCVKLI